MATVLPDEIQNSAVRTAAVVRKRPYMAGKSDTSERGLQRRKKTRELHRLLYIALCVGSKMVHWTYADYLYPWKMALREFLPKSGEVDFSKAG